MADLSVVRKEVKYLLDDATAARLRSALGAFMPLDPMGGPDGYEVRSLYFDTVYDKDYNDKVDGIEVRRKIRLRIYSSGDAVAKLELKEKSAAGQRKRSTTVAREDAALLLAGRYAALRAKMPSPFAQELLGIMEVEGYVPRTVVAFRRLAFMDRTNNTRVTFDSRLCASESCFDLFAARLACYPIPHPLILEVKYANFLLSHIYSALCLANQVPVSVSKYCLGRQVSFF